MTQTADIIHYSADEPKSGILRTALGSPAYLVRIWRYRGLVHNFFWRELHGRFRGSLLGILWVLMQPLFLFAVYYTVFGIFLGGARTSEGNDPRFAFYLFSGIVLYSTFLEGTTGALSVIVGKSNLVKKVAFPSELLPITPVLVSGIVYLVGTVVMVVVGSIAGQVHLGVATLAWPLLVVLMIVAAAGTGLALSCINVFARDIGHLWRILTQAMFFLSPVFWYPTFVEEKAPGATDWLVLNPVYCLLMAQRQVFGVAEGELSGTLLGNLSICALWAVVLFMLGYGLFMSRKHKFADLV